MKMISHLFISNAIVLIFSISTFAKNPSIVNSGIKEMFPGKALTQDSNTPFQFDSMPGVRKIKDVLIYQDATFYSTFPSVVKRPDGELLVAFRRAPTGKYLEKRVQAMWIQTVILKWFVPKMGNTGQKIRA